MTDRPENADLQELRRRAVERLEGRRGELADMPEQDVTALVYELEVHQVELEVQNEELRRVQLELAEALARYRDLFERAPVGYLTLDGEGVILQANRAAVQLCARDRDALEDRRLETVVLSDDRHKLVLLLDQAAALGQPQALDFRIERPTGHARWVHADVAPLSATDGAASRYRMTLTDVTGRVAAEEALRQLNETLESRVAERTEVAERRAEALRRLAAQLNEAEHRERERLSRLLHDGLQQLLVAARLRLPALLAAGPDERAEHARRMEELLTECVSTSRNLTWELSPPVLRMGELVDVVEWVGTWCAENHRLTTVVEVDGRVPSVPEHVRVFIFQAVREMLLNVVKHSGAMAACVRLLARDGHLVVEVDDEGEVFDPRVVEGHLSQPEGFGLFHIRERVEALGGALEVEAKAGGGGRFRIIVPIADDHSPPRLTAPSAP